MDQQRQNKEFIARYYNGISGVVKTRELLEELMTDESLFATIAFFDTAFPCYDIYADEMISEGNKVVVQARFTGYHKGEFNGIPPTNRKVDFPFAIKYEIENGKIARHWLIGDSMALMEQLGIGGDSKNNTVP